MLEITIEGVNTLITMNRALLKKDSYTKETRNKLNSLANSIRNRVGDVKMAGILNLRMEIYTADKRKIDTMNVAHLILNAGNNIAWDDGQFWHLKIDRFLLPKGQTEYTRCFISDAITEGGDKKGNNSKV